MSLKDQFLESFNSMSKEVDKLGGKLEMSMFGVDEITLESMDKNLSDLPISSIDQLIELPLVKNINKKIIAKVDEINKVISFVSKNDDGERHNKLKYDTDQMLLEILEKLYKNGYRYRNIKC